jgi:hypothetical protein
VTVALIAVVVIAVGLPLLAWWLGGRPFWSRLRPGAEPDPWGDAVRRFGLTPPEAAQVESAVNWGRRLDDARLRPAAVAWAQQRIDEQKARQRVHSPWARVVALVALLLLLGGSLALMTFIGGGFPWGTLVWWVPWMVGTAWFARGPRRAVRLNSEPSSDGDRQGRPADGGRTAE